MWLLLGLNGQCVRYSQYALLSAIKPLEHGLPMTSGMNVLVSARTSVDRGYNGSRPCLGRTNEVALNQEEFY